MYPKLLGAENCLHRAGFNAVGDLSVCFGSDDGFKLAPTRKINSGASSSLAM